MPRRVTLVLTEAASAPPVVVEPFDVETPWWPDVEPVVKEAARRFDVDVTVLRLLDATCDEHDPSGMAGAVTYLGETAAADLDLLARQGRVAPWAAGLDDHPLRASWARPGGPALHLAWADRALDASGRPRIGPAEQVKTWNLSGLWRIPTTAGPAWLKTVPPFFAHEGRVIAALGRAPVPPLLAADDGRSLLADVPGEDQWGAALGVLLEMVEHLVALQARWIGRTDDLLALGAADFRPPALSSAAASTIEGASSPLSTRQRAVLSALVDGLDRRFDAVECCGVPESLVHGDFHPGNVRGVSQALVLLDWGDCGVGHPLLDMDAMLASTAGRREAEPLRAAWFDQWNNLVPGCDPGRAADLLAPVSCLRNAVVYQGFLDAIEPSEQLYHAGDVANALERAVDAVERSVL
ncbi:MAG: aminoglycoside phosphotransferase family protein [Acidimicrobiales bacterium]